MLPGLKLTGKNGRNRLGEYPNPRRNGESERGRNKEGRRKYKEEKREEERKKTTRRRKEEPQRRGRNHFHQLSRSRMETKSTMGTPWPFRLQLQSKDISHLRNHDEMHIR